MDTALRPLSSAIGTAIIGVLGLLVLLMSQAAQVQVNVQAQPRQNAKTIFTAVIADDQPTELASTTVAVGVVIRALGYEPRILPAVNVVQVVSLALTGNDGAQANAVFLDGGYGSAANLMDWVIRDPSGILEGLAEGNTLAAFLRASGYEGPIVLTSRLPEDYLNQPGGENFGIGLKKVDFWGNPLKFLEALRNILK